MPPTGLTNLTRLQSQASDRRNTAVKRKLAKRLSQPQPGLENQQPDLTRRWATVSAVNSDGTVQLTMDGQLLTDQASNAGPLPVKTIDSYAPTAGDTVMVDWMGSDLVVAGTVGGNTAWAALPYAASWSDFGTGSGVTYRAGQYRMKAGDVFLRGVAKYAGSIASGAQATIATLPAGFRPSVAEPFLVSAQTETGAGGSGWWGRVDVLSTGAIVVTNNEAAATPNPTWVALSMVRFEPN